MNLATLIIRSLAWHWRMHLAVFLGVVTAGAVLTGALVIGDSMRGSLRDLTLERLGRVDTVLVSPRFFRVKLAAEIAASESAQKHFSGVIPVIMIQASMEFRTKETYSTDSATEDEVIAAKTHRAGKVQVLGCAPDDWRRLDAPPLFNGLQLNQIVLNAPLADALQIKVGDELILRLPRPTDIPPDSPLGRKTEAALSRRLYVTAIIPADGLGRFGLQPTQQLPRNAFVSLETLQDLLKQEEKANALLVFDNESREPSGAEAEETLRDALRPTLADYGLLLTRNERGFWQLTSDTLLLPQPMVERVGKWIDEQQRVKQESLVYLANWVAAPGGKARIPYSTVAALDFFAAPPFGPWRDMQGEPLTPLTSNEIVLNQWAAEDLAAQGTLVKPGDAITLTFFEPESTHGETAEREASFTLRGIVPMDWPALDKTLTPELQGITDQDSLANWDPPFPYFPERVRSAKPNDQDERYWDDFRATPKAFVSFETGQKLWSSRFGRVTALRFAAKETDTRESLEQTLLAQLPPEAFGFVWQPVKRLGLAASSGTTPFDGLFLAFSMFLIVSALLLVSLLFKLGIERRARELGIELACGFTEQRLRTQCLGEAFVVALSGAVVGAVVGVLFAMLMIHGLRTWWVAAVVTPFLQLHFTPRAIALGIVITLAVALLTIFFALRRLTRVGARQLLAGQANPPRLADDANRGRGWWWAALTAVAAIGVVAFGSRLSGEAQAGAFFGSGALLLTAALLAVRERLHAVGRTGENATSGLQSLAWSNAARAPGRSVLTIALLATAVFLIVAISAFRLQPPPSGRDPNAGDGGFAIWAESDLPLYPDLADAAARQEKLGFAAQPPTQPPPQQPLSDWSDAEKAEFFASRATIIPCRVQSGEDASCLNLYKPRRPRMIGISPRLIDRGGFTWAALPGDLSAAEKESPWRVLERNWPNNSMTDSEQEPVPIILDQNTALYSLQLYKGVGQYFTLENDTGGKQVYVVAGLLKNSIFQGDMLISEASFRRLFPSVSGYRLFLIAPGEGDEANKVAASFEETLSDFGFLTEPTRDRLVNFMAVQNTYLSTFQSLGGLGLLLGTIGLAVAQLRGAFERRGELALMQAIGFSRATLGQLLLRENLVLLLAGLVIGALAALVAIGPNLLRGDAGIPWLTLGLILGLVVVLALLTGLLATRAALRAPVVTTLRGEGG